MAGDRTLQHTDGERCARAVAEPQPKRQERRFAKPLQHRSMGAYRALMACHRVLPGR